MACKPLFVVNYCLSLTGFNNTFELLLFLQTYSQQHRTVQLGLNIFMLNWKRELLLKLRIFSGIRTWIMNSLKATTYVIANEDKALMELEVSFLPVPHTFLQSVRQMNGSIRSETSWLNLICRHWFD